MDIIEIIKDSFVFPSTDIKTLLIYVVLSVVAAAFCIFGTIMYAMGIAVPELFMWGGIAIVISLLIGWVLSGYLITVIKSGIEMDENVPQFVWWDNFITGFDSFIVAIVYFLIPAFIVVVVGYLSHIFENLAIIAHEISSQAWLTYLGSTIVITDALSHALVNLLIGLTFTLTVAVVVFVIFSFIQCMAEARLANTGSLGEALNVFEAAKDIKRIGILKAVAVIILVIIIVGIVGAVLSAITNLVPILSILSVFVTPYMAIFAQRAVGLLYSDIA